MGSGSFAFRGSRVRYSIAFHWTLAQFHGSMELYPVTVEAGCTDAALMQHGFETSFLLVP